jgi:hypothetical protein
VTGYLLPDLIVNGHTPRCCARTFPHSDAAKRVSDAVNLHYAAIGWDSAKKWIAVRLEDGSGGNQLYDTKRDAIRHQLDEFLCAYLCLTGVPMNVCEAELILKFHRQAYDNGFRLVDPDSVHGGRDLIPRVTYEDKRQQVRALGG